jgi:DNA-binding NtrC family response regulator
MKAKFLFISGTEGLYWLPILKDAADSLAVVDFEEKEKAVELILQQNYDIIFVDATVVDDIPALISGIKRYKHNANIVVVTATPTWTRAREAFYAGAIDYIYKSSSKSETLSALQTILTKSYYTNQKK